MTKGKSFESVGMKLRALREEKGISLRDMSERTRIPMNVLEGIEAGDPNGLPAPVFLRGFLRTYAKEIKLDPDEIVNEFRMLYPDQTGSVAVPITARRQAEKRSKGWTAFLFFLVAVAAVIAAGIHYYPQWQDGSLFSSISGKSVSAVNETAPAQENTIQPPAMPVPSPEAATGSGNQAAPMDNPEAAQQPAVAPPGESPGAGDASASAAPVQGHQLKLEFDQESWVQVVIDNSKLEHGLYEAGASATWTADEGFSVRLGNAGGVKVIFDGRNLGKIGPLGKAASINLPQ